MSDQHKAEIRHLKEKNAKLKDKLEWATFERDTAFDCLNGNSKALYSAEAFDILMADSLEKIEQLQKELAECLSTS